MRLHVHPPDKSKLHPEVTWLLAAIKREEGKLEKELGELQHQLNGVRAAARALGSKAGREVVQIKKRLVSAAARAKISRATKVRWAKFRAEKNKKAKARDRAL